MISRHETQATMAALGYDSGIGEAQSQRARDFRKVCGGNNFMTPQGLGFYRLKAKPYVIVEISTGEPFLGHEMIGLTAVDCATQERLFDDSTCINSLDELAEYFTKLERKFS